jgi:hypothetical protein
MQILLARAGLTLNPGQMADLVLAWRQVAGLLGLISSDRRMADDQAFVFRLPGPEPMATTITKARPDPAPPIPIKPRAPAKKKAAARPAAKPAARKKARRGS